MKSLRWHVAGFCAAVLAIAPGAMAQQVPHIGYIYPAGGKQGTVVDVTIGGQYLNGVNSVLVSGEGVEATVVKHTRPIPRNRLNQIGQKLRELQKKYKLSYSKSKIKDRGGMWYKAAAEFKAYTTKLGYPELDVRKYMELRKKMFDPKRQPNPQLGELVELKLTFDRSAKPGPRELRLKTSLGVTNPLVLHVGQYTEYSEKEPNDKTADGGVPKQLPVILNGQIMPGDVDRFRFTAKKGTRVVAAVSARELIPYLADAVPGWFQATLTLRDAKGSEVAYTDDFRFNPDPIIYYKIPADGEYVLEIKDSIYRGREDFVYRIALGELPFITSVFPLGGRIGAKTQVRVTGWNLPVTGLALTPKRKTPGVMPVSVWRNKRCSNRVPFALDTLPERTETESGTASSRPQPVTLPLIVNGRIGRPGDQDVFSFKGRAGDQVVAEVRARRLGSPLDSLLKLTDASGKPLAVNDDHEDKGAGLTTHQADSRLSVKLPANGTYTISLSDTQKKGSQAHAYRLRISLAQPDFELRIVPSSINARAGMNVPITAYALRKDGFTGQIELRLKDAPDGFALTGGWIPAGQDKLRLTLSVPPKPPKKPLSLHLEGRAVIGRQVVSRTAVPAEDMMQAFLYRHLVPSDDWMVAVTGKSRYGPPLKVLATGPVKLPVGGTAKVRVAGPSGPFMKQVKLALNNPPEGIVVKKVSPDPKGLMIELGVETDKGKPGMKGNLIVDAFVERSFKRKDGKQSPKRRYAVGTLPAIPFEVVAATIATSAKK